MKSTIRSKVPRGTLERESLLEVQTEKVEMTLNTDNAIASGLLIQRLTELYENPIEASVRETVSNAMDAIAAGPREKRGVVKITSPTKLQPIFKVEDSGCGMTYDDLKNVYAKYGASTKVNNFDQIGAYGLGAKAPLAYGTEFIVSSTKDGIRTTIIVAREELTNYIKIIDSIKTDEPNGTTVSIPVAEKDIEEFKRYIRNYEDYPFSKDNLDFFVDDKKVECGNFIHISNEIPILEENGEILTSNIWIRNDTSAIVNLIYLAKLNNFKNNFLYTIGGWPYQNPGNRLNKKEKSSIVIELKPGVLGFNSSRDFILKNDNYYKFKDLVEKYISSKSFVDKLVSKVNKKNLSDFKNILHLLLKYEKNNIMIEKDAPADSEMFYQKTALLMEIENLIHEETGYSISEIFKGLPKAQKNSVLILENKRSYSSKVSSYCIANPHSEDFVKIPVEKSKSISEIDRFVEDCFSGRVDSEDLKSLILYLIIKLKEISNLSFITDVKYSKEHTSEYYKVRSERKWISKIYSFNNTAFESYVFYTEHSKEEIEKILKFASFSSKNILVKTAKDFLGDLEKYKNENEEQKKPILRFYSYNESNSKLEEISKIEKKKGVKNIILLSNSHQLKKNLHRAIENWVYNSHGLDKGEFNIYYSVGRHNVSEIAELSCLGELHQYPIYTPDRVSKMYLKTVKRDELKFHFLRNDEVDLNKKAFILILELIQNDFCSKIILESIEIELKKIKGIADKVGIEMKHDLVNLTELIKFAESMDYNLIKAANSMNYNNSIEEESISYLLTLITEEQKILIEKLSMLNCLKHCSLRDNIGIYNYNLLLNVIPHYNEIELLRSENAKVIPVIKEAKERFEDLARKVDEINRELSELKFN